MLKKAINRALITQYLEVHDKIVAINAFNQKKKGCF